MPKPDGTQLYQQSLEVIPPAWYEQAITYPQLLLLFATAAVGSFKLDIDEGVPAIGLNILMLAISVMADYQSTTHFDKLSQELASQDVTIPLKESNPRALSLSKRRITELLVLVGAGSLYPPIGYTSAAIFFLATLNNRRKNRRLEYIQSQLEEPTLPEKA